MTVGKIMITGASSGIGATYAERLASRGHDLIVVARNRTRLDELAARLFAETGVSIEVIEADLNKASDLEAVSSRVRTDTELQWLINNAGVAGGGAMVSADPIKLNEIIDLNIRAVTHLAAAAAANFAAKRSGTLINISSVTALMPEMFGQPVYLASKSYVLAFTEALHQELAGQNVRVQVVVPGATRTEIWERSGGSVDNIPAERLMEVGDMVDAALAGLEQGELVTIPSLPDAVDWEEFRAARSRLQPNLSRAQPAVRYNVG